MRNRHLLAEYYLLQFIVDSFSEQQIDTHKKELQRSQLNTLRSWLVVEKEEEEKI